MPSSTGAKPTPRGHCRALAWRLTAAVSVTLLFELPAFTAPQQRDARATSPGVRITIANGRVRHLGSARLFALENLSDASSRIVLVPRDDTMPPDGSIVIVSGILRPLDQVDAGPAGRTADFKDDMVLVARSVMTENGTDIVRGTSAAPSIARLLRQSTARIETPGRTQSETPVGPTTLANFFDELAGQDVRVTHARVVGMINPRLFVIEPATSFQMMLGARDRLAVLLAENAALRVDAATLVGSTVMVAGVARTPLGLSVSREVAWPTELSRDAMRRLEVRGAILASSVQSPDGVELTVRSR